jgi:hypothetical protein
MKTLVTGRARVPFGFSGDAKGREFESRHSDLRSQRVNFSQGTKLLCFAQRQGQTEG